EVAAHVAARLGGPSRLVDGEARSGHPRPSARDDRAIPRFRARIRRDEEGGGAGTSCENPQGRADESDPVAGAADPPRREELRIEVDVPAACDRSERLRRNWTMSRRHDRAASRALRNDDVLA